MKNKLTRIFFPPPVLSFWSYAPFSGGGRLVRRCWVNFQCRGVLLIWIILGQGLVDCFGFNVPLRQYYSLYRAVSQREGERRETIDESKNVHTSPNRTHCKRSRPLPYYNPKPAGRPGTGSSPSTIALSDHPLLRQGPIALAVGAGGGCLDIFSLIYHFSVLSPSLWRRPDID